MHRAAFVGMLIVGLLAAAPARAASIALVFPPSAFQGDLVLVVGSGFGAHGPAISVCEAGARVLIGSPETAIFVVPNAVSPGPCPLVVTANGRTASAAFTVRNRPPHADAGPAQTVGGRTARLDGTRSTDPDGQPLRYAWSVVSSPVGGAARLSDSSAATPSVTADSPGTYTFRLTVTDSAGATATALTQVTFGNAAPVIDSIVATSLTPPAGATISLTAVAHDPDPGDNAKLAVHWTVVAPQGSTASFSNPTSLSTDLSTDVAGLYTVTLRVTDPWGAFAAQSLSVNAQSADTTPPVVQVLGVADGELTNAAALFPTFSATDDHLASVSATLDGAPFAGGTPVASEGQHVLVVTAVDVAGNRATSTVHFTLDRTPPVIVIGGVSDGERRNAPATIVFSVSDANFAAAQATLDGVAFASGSAVAAEGQHVLVVTATDAAGNSATATVHFTIDRTPPLVQIVTPGDGSVVQSAVVPVTAQVSDDGGLATVAANGAPLTLGADGAYRGSVPLAEGANTVTVVAVDLAGNTATVAAHVVLDTTPPSLSVAAPADDAHIGALATTVTGNVSDATSVVVNVNGAPAPVAADGSFSTAIALMPGTNAIVVTATDAAGNAGAVTRHVRANATPPSLEVSAPSDGLRTAASSVAVVGTASAADPADAVAVTVNGSPVATAADGSFSTTVPLAPGSNDIHVVATDGYGLSSTTALTVVQDAAPPELDVTSPLDGALIGGASVLVAGTARDASGVSVTVNGADAPVAADGSFAVTVALAPGANTIVITATDGVGNATHVERQVRSNTTPPSLTVYALDGARIPDTTAEVHGSAIAAVPGDHATVTVSGVAASVQDDGSFKATVPIVTGDNVLHVVAVDGYGLSTSKDVTVEGVQFGFGTDPTGVSTLSGTPLIVPAGTARLFAPEGLFSNQSSVGLMSVYLRPETTATLAEIGFYFQPDAFSPLLSLLGGHGARFFVHAGWNTFGFPPGPIAGRIAVLGLDGDLVLDEAPGGTGSASTSGSTGLSGLPSTWAGGTDTTEGPPAAIVSADNPPTAAILSPVDGAAVSGAFSVDVDAEDDVYVSSVTLIVDGVRTVPLVVDPPWRFTVDSTSLANGPHRLQAEVADSAGYRVRTNTVLVLVDNP